MGILVVCPGCRKRFQVGDQFAGKTGPCPKCKTPIRIPTKDEEVKVHAPTAFAGGGRSRTGELLLKPVSRKYFKWHTLTAVSIAAASLVVLAVTYLLRSLITDFLIFRILGLVIVSPPLVMGGYIFLHDDELEPYRGKPLWVRAAILASVYVVLWGMFGRIADLILTGELWNWLLIAPPFLVMGGLMALACLDLEFGDGFLLYFFYVLVTIILRWAGGLGWLWELGKDKLMY